MCWGWFWGQCTTARLYLPSHTGQPCSHSRVHSQIWSVWSTRVLSKKKGVFSNQLVRCCLKSQDCYWSVAELYNGIAPVLKNPHHSVKYLAELTGTNSLTNVLQRFEPTATSWVGFCRWTFSQVCTDPGATASPTTKIMGTRNQPNKQNICKHNSNNRHQRKGSVMRRNPNRQRSTPPDQMRPMTSCSVQAVNGQTPVYDN